MVKADIFLLPKSPFAASEWSRRQWKQIGPEADSPAAYVASAEDMILQKLNRYRLTGERSDRQWGDVQGMLKVPGADRSAGNRPDRRRHGAGKRDMSVV
jgi:hypothetical protein